ncbi:hypothetical protein, partial [Staphylococcus saprophyticus]|uniref:hypothetical protein n=1 Tax=Staphylococcus saprophyticus TaxID=29385 RepID=UPI001C92FDE1
MGINGNIKNTDCVVRGVLNSGNNCGRMRVRKLNTSVATAVGAPRAGIGKICGKIRERIGGDVKGKKRINSDKDRIIITGEDS